MRTAIKGLYQWCIAQEVRYTYMVWGTDCCGYCSDRANLVDRLATKLLYPLAQALSFGALLDLDEVQDRKLFTSYNSPYRRFQQ